MGLFDWLRRGATPPTDKTARWLHDRIVEATRAGDVIAIANACAVLRRGGMAFGMIVGDFPERDRVLERALAALRELGPTMPDAQADAVFAAVESAALPIDIAPWRARITEARRAALAAATTRLGDAIERATTGELADACIALRQHQRRVLGLEVPAGAEVHAVMLARAVARLAERIPALTDDECADILPQLQRARVPIDVSARHAQWQAARTQARERGLADSVAGEPRNDALERAIAVDLDDAAAYAVLADWLQQHGHPRGELMALQLRAETDPRLGPTADALLETHEATLLGPLVPHRIVHDGSGRQAFTWQRGFVASALISNDDNVGDAGAGMADILALVLAHPSGRYLRTLALGINGDYEAGLDDVLALLDGARAPHLRELTLGDFTRDQCEISWFTVGNVGPVWAALPALRAITVRGGTFELGTIVHAALTRAVFETGGLSGSAARAIASAQCPQLAHLEVWYGDPAYGAEATLSELQPLLARTDLPALRHLGLKNAAFTDEICAALARSPLAAQVETLDLGMGTMGPAGAAALVAAAPKLARVRVLDVSANYLDEPTIAALRGAFPEVLAGDQRHADGDEDRYPAVGE